MEQRTILILSGTNRPNSSALKVSRILKGLYEGHQVAAEILSLEQMTPEVFEPASYAKKPPAMVAMQNQVLQARGLHVVTPEYNGSFPGALKYFIDMLKFPESFERKHVAFVGEASGLWGAIRAVEQLQMIFGYRNAHVFPDRVFIPGIVQKIDSDGRLIDAAMRERLDKQVASFDHFIRRFE